MCLFVCLFLRSTLTTLVFCILQKYLSQSQLRHLTLLTLCSSLFAVNGSNDTIQLNNEKNNNKGMQ